MPPLFPLHPPASSAGPSGLVMTTEYAAAPVAPPALAAARPFSTHLPVRRPVGLGDDQLERVVPRRHVQLHRPAVALLPRQLRACTHGGPSTGGSRCAAQATTAKHLCHVGARLHRASGSPEGGKGGGGGGEGGGGGPHLQSSGSRAWVGRTPVAACLPCSHTRIHALATAPWEPHAPG